MVDVPIILWLNEHFNSNGKLPITYVLQPRHILIMDQYERFHKKNTFLLYHMYFITTTSSRAHKI